MAIEESSPAAGAPGLSVVVALSTDDDPTALVESLTDHAPGPGLLEIILVRSGPGRETRALTAGGGPLVRRLRLSDPSLVRARLLGLRSARRGFVTFLRPRDRISIEALSVATQLAKPDEIVALRVASGGQPGDAAGQGKAPAEPSRRDLTGPADDPLSTDASLGSVRWIIPTCLASTVCPPTHLGRWWELLLVAGIHCRSRAPARWATSGADGPDVVCAPESPITSWNDVDPLLGTIAALEALIIRDPACAGTVDSMAHRLARQLRPLLIQEPNLRVPLLDAIVTARIRRFPFSELTDGLSADLAIAYSFPPSQDTSAVVAARRLRERGRVVDVVSCDLRRGKDPGTSVIAGGLVDRDAQLPGPASYGQWPDIEAFVRTGLATVGSWVDQGREYRALYSRSMWPASHMLAALLKLRIPELVWSAEFSDPMQLTIRGRRRFDAIDERSPFTQELLSGLHDRGLPSPTSDNLWEWVEHLAFALADEVLFTNRNQQEVMLAATKDEQLRDRALRLSSVRPHPQPPDTFYGYANPPYPLDSGLLHLGYFGRFYANRGIGEVLAAIRDSPRDVQESLHLHVFSDTPESVLTHAREAGVRRFVTSNPYLPYFDFLAMTRLIDVLVVNDTETAATHEINPYLPSKLSDYLGSGSEIWAICEQGSAMSAVPVRYRSTLGDAVAARGILQQATAAKSQDDEPRPPRPGLPGSR